MSQNNTSGDTLTIDDLKEGFRFLEQMSKKVKPPQISMFTNK